MRRRRLCTCLAGLAVPGVAGCITGSSDGAPRNETADPSEATDDGTSSREPAPRPDDARRSVEVVSSDELPDGAPLSASIRARRPWITEQRTALLELSTTNTGSSSRQVHPLHGDAASSQTGESGVVLYGNRNVQARDDPTTYAESDCWEDGAPTTDEVEFTTGSPPTLDLAPGDTGSTVLVVADDPSAWGCFPPGRYRFEDRNIVAETEFTWEFTLEVRDETGEQ